MADAVLVPYDIQTNRAHCAMLCDRGIIPPARLKAIDRALKKIERDWRAGAFQLDPALEDVHINIERAVASISGEAAAGVMHTARSRNDQTATDIRLWLRDQLLASVEALAELLDAAGSFASRHARTVMAGWTHGQPAMPTSLGHWAAAHAFALRRDLDELRNLYALVNRSPLGAAAGFGSAWPIDRELTARLLGFDSPQLNSLDCVSTRWEAEARLGFALSLTMAHLSSLGQDLIFLISPPRRLVRLHPSFTTGSSIMPQKRNPDFAEVTRARAANVQALAGAALGIGRGALSGYNRDSQWTKYWILDLVDEFGEAPRLFARVLATLEPDKKALAAAAKEDFVSAVDFADYIASTRGVEFRRLYHIIGQAVVRDEKAGRFSRETINALLREARIEPPLGEDEFARVADPARAIAERRSLGSPHPDDVKSQSAALRKAAREASKWSAARRRELAVSAERLQRKVASLSAA